ncbi:uncharacterized protein si:dkey-20d21.12 [Gadus chalcogrammus]|uniref:uncharacterized protein si:dkey-20d21.12 n=1 Tax=Gadus chalcogrammus TaxID=1042646 RepID=UPI0024C3BED2|nr:uncharacterized protein si:dkey-20d21.12 [Gadus chalcogrammus]
MSRPPSTHTTPQSYRISDRDLTEIQLHSVDSINDLHRMHPEHGHRGIRPPLSPAHSPSSNGNPCFPGRTDVNELGQPISAKLQKHLGETWGSGSSRVYIAACGLIAFLLLMLFVTVYFLVQQGGAMRTLTEAVREKQDVSMEISKLIQELQALRHNLTALRDRP